MKPVGTAIFEISIWIQLCTRGRHSPVQCLFFAKNYKNICVYVYDGCSPGEKINLVFEIGFLF
jgi:hypothetical protein